MLYAATRIHLATLANLLALQVFAQPAQPQRVLVGKPQVQAQVAKTSIPRVETENYPDGSTKKETPYLNGKIHGEVKEYWPGGQQLKSLTRYDKGLRQGIAETYFDNGRVETRVPYRNDKMEGLFEKLDNPTAKRDANGVGFQPVIIEQVTYVNGLKEGPRKTWRRINVATAGELSSEATYRNDKLHGDAIGYGPGDGRSIRRYQDGLLEGLEEHFTATGKGEINWKADRKHGLSRHLLNRYGSWPTWEEEWSNGALVSRKELDYFMLGGFTKIKRIESFNNAHKLHGKSEFWRAADIREKTLTYADGLQHGPAEYYDSTGAKVIRREMWVKGAKITDLVAPSIP